MANTLSKFKGILAGGGARPNLFQVNIDKFPGTAAPLETSNALRFLCKGAQLPESTVGLVEVPFRGRTFKVAGDRTYAPWSITVINDTDFLIRNAMENWMQFIAQYQDGSGATNPNDYMVDATVQQLFRQDTTQGATSGEGVKADKTGQYTFYDIFPTSISAIDLSYDSSDVLEEFTVEFQVQYWAPSEKKDAVAATTQE
tara:strand:- start:102 stop:701 length:600 start_codon:yes stop_codon:yes gene_type:complete